MKSRVDKQTLVEPHKQEWKESEEEVKRGLEVVKEKILPKRGLFIIRKPVRDFLAEHYLIPTSEDSIGGKGLSDEIIDFLFMKGRIDPASNECLARYYQRHQPEYWNIMKKYLKRFFLVRSHQREFPKVYDFHPWDHPRPDNYPTAKEQLRAWDKACKVGNDKLSDREKHALRICLDEEREKQSEIIYDTLSMIGHPFGWTLPDFNFRYVAFFDPDLKDFWRWTGLDADENLKFFLSKNVFSYHWVNIYGRKYKWPKHSLFDSDHHSDYAQLKAQLTKSAKVPKKFFQKIEDVYLYLIQFKDLIPILSRIIRPLFIVAYFLEEEDPDIYNYHQELAKIFLSAMDSKNPLIKKWAMSEVCVRRVKDFLFDAVWQDFLFDGKRYLEKPKVRKKTKGRPPDIDIYLLVYLTVNELSKYKAKISGSVNLTTAKLINRLLREKRFNIRKRHQYHYYNLGAEAVRRIYTKAEKMFGGA